MTDFRMNKKKPIGSRTLSTIAGYTPARRLAPKQAFEVTPETNVVEEVSVAEALGEMIISTEAVEAAADGVVKTGIEVPADGKEHTVTLGKDEDTELVNKGKDNGTKQSEESK